MADSSKRINNKGWFIKRLEEFTTLVKDAVRSDNTPQKIALGMGIGVFVSFSPFIGLQIWIALALAFITRANKLSAAAGTLVANPVTMPLFYSIEYFIGSKILGNESSFSLVPFSRLNEFLTQSYHVVVSIFTGFLVVGIVAGCIAYILTYRFTLVFRSNRKKRDAA